MLLHSKPIEDAAATVTGAAAADAAGLAALSAQALPPGWPADEIAASCCDPNRAVLRAASGGKVNGFVILQFATDEAEILAIAVAADQRRRGCASSLMRAAAGACLKRSVSCIYLEVAESNRPARKLYEKFGFLEVGRRENYYTQPGSAPETALILKLNTQLFVSLVDQQESST